MNLRDMIHIDPAWKLGWTILHSLWQGVLIAALHATAMGLLRRRSPPLRYAASLCGLALLLGAGVVTFQIVPPPPHVISDLRDSAPAPLATSAEIAAPHTSTPAASSAPQLTSTPPVAIRPAATDHINKLLRAIANALQPATPWIACLWAAGVLLIGIWHTGGWIATRRMSILALSPVDSQVAAICARIAQRLNLTRTLRVFQSALVETPLVIGWFKPMILLPAAVLTGLTPTQLEAILAHEIAHVRRHDYIFNLLQVVAETLMFYHPAAWRISRRIRLEREQCCDDLAIAICGDRYEYAQSLAALEEVRLSSPLTLAVRGNSGSELLTRVRRLLSTEPDPGRRHPRLSIILAILIAAGVTALSCEKHPSQSQTSSEIPTPEQLIEKLRLAYHPIQNLHVIDFELTEEFQPEGSTHWQKTPFRIAGSAWYGDPTTGQARIDVTQQTIPTQSPVGTWVEMAYTAVFDGQNGRVLQHTMGQIGKATPLLRATNYPPGKPPEELKPFAFSRYATGIAYAPEFHAKGDANFATSFQRGLDRGIKLNISSDAVEGKPAIKLAPTWAKQTADSLSFTWFDPNHGYAYLGKERAVGGRVAESERITEFTQTAPGIWFPLQAWHRRPPKTAAPKGRHRYTYKAKAVVANDPAFDPAIFTVTIPANYFVIDMKPPVAMEATTFPAPAPTAQGAIEDKNRRRSANNLKAIGMGLTLYANEMHGLYPPDLATMAKSQEMSKDTLKSPMGNPQVGYDYAYLHFKAMTHGLPADLAIAYDAPDSAQSGGACVLFGDGHVQWLNAAALKSALEQAGAVKNGIASKPAQADSPTK